MLLEKEIRYLTPKQVEKHFGMTSKWLANLRWAGRGPAFLKVGKKKVLYSVEDIESWIKSNARKIETSVPEISSSDLGM